MASHHNSLAGSADSLIKLLLKEECGLMLRSNQNRWLSGCRFFSKCGVGYHYFLDLVGPPYYDQIIKNMSLQFS